MYRFVFVCGRKAPSYLFVLCALLVSTYIFVSVFRVIVGIHVHACVRVPCRYPCTCLCPCSL